VFDAGALIALERANPRIRALCREALKTGVQIVVPAGVLGQVWRNEARQVVLRALLREATTVVPVLDQILAQAAGILCGRRGTSDLIDATVVLAAQQARAPVITSDPEDLRQLDPTLRIEKI
jgi:predicted kinase